MRSPTRREMAKKDDRAERLVDRLMTVPISALIDHIDELKTMKGAADYGGGTVLEIRSAVQLATSVLVARQEEHRQVAANLRQLAACKPTPSADGSTNLAAWVGADTVEWHAVFGLSAPPPDVWFCHLSELSQSMMLLLAAEILEHP